MKKSKNKKAGAGHGPAPASLLTPPPLIKPSPASKLFNEIV
jgi:hypothetical protein